MATVVIGSLMEVAATSRPSRRQARDCTAIGVFSTIPACDTISEHQHQEPNAQHKTILNTAPIRLNLRASSQRCQRKAARKRQVKIVTDSNGKLSSKFRIMLEFGGLAVTGCTLVPVKRKTTVCSTVVKSLQYACRELCMQKRFQDIICF